MAELSTLRKKRGTKQDIDTVNYRVYKEAKTSHIDKLKQQNHITIKHMVQT